MKIFSAAQIKNWDGYTIQNEPVSSGLLMERAAGACFRWLEENYSTGKTFKIFCGKGNNGGDGLAIARMLTQKGYNASVYIPGPAREGTGDFKNNLAALEACNDKVFDLLSEADFPLISGNEIIIDALLGTGLNKPPDTLLASLILYINRSGATIIAIDIPSGMYADKSSKENIIIKAGCTLTFQVYKRAFLVAENEEYSGKIVVLDILLHPAFYEEEATQFELLDLPAVKRIYKPRKPFSNKGDFGHALLLAGSYGMMGAAVLAAKACLRTGTGKLTCTVCGRGYDIMQVSAPEAMCKVAGDKFITGIDTPLGFSAVGIGPGIGLHKSHKDLLRDLFTEYKKPVVIDADALNVISRNKKLLSLVPAGSILTPHPKEFDRLFGTSANDFDRMDLAMEKAREHTVYIVLKGHHTFIATPGKTAYFNSTGNAGMAKGGSGDVLTGILTGLAAQKYSSPEVCLLGVFLHGMSGDIAAERFSEEAMLPGDIINCLGEAFKNLA